MSYISKIISSNTDLTKIKSEKNGYFIVFPHDLYKKKWCEQTNKVFTYTGPTMTILKLWKRIKHHQPYPEQFVGARVSTRRRESIIGMNQLQIIYKELLNFKDPYVCFHSAFPELTELTELTELSEESDETESGGEIITNSESSYGSGGFEG